MSSFDLDIISETLPAAEDLYPVQGTVPGNLNQEP